MFLVLVAYHAVIDLAGSSAYSLRGLLGSSLDRYSENEQDLSKQEYYNRKDSDHRACNFVKGYCDRASDNAAG